MLKPRYDPDPENISCSMDEILMLFRISSIEYCFLMLSIIVSTDGTKPWVQYFWMQPLKISVNFGILVKNHPFS